VSYKKQKSLTLREHLDLPPVFGGVRVAHLFSFLCCVCRFVSSIQCCQYLMMVYYCPFGFLSCLFSETTKNVLNVEHCMIIKYIEHSSGCGHFVFFFVKYFQKSYNLHSSIMSYYIFYFRHFIIRTAMLFSVVVWDLSFENQ